jgi:DNA-binding CsgD family transcriptional regulator
METLPRDAWLRRVPELLLLVTVLLVGAVGVTVINRWATISGTQVLELVGASCLYLAHTLAGERYVRRFVSPPARAVYFFIQILLATGLLYLIARLGVIGSGVFVFVPLLVQSVSLLRWPHGTAWITAIGFAAFLLVLGAEIGTANLAEAAIGYALMAAFVILMMRHVIREREARYQVQALADQLQAYIERAAPTRNSQSLSEPLTVRETQVLQCVCRGMSNKAIAEALHLAEGTVKNHMTSVLGKLAVRDRTQAALKARDLGLA